MSVEYKGIVSSRITKELEKELKREASDKGLDYAQYVRQLLENRNNLVSTQELDELNKREPIYKVTTVEFKQHSIEQIIAQFEDNKEQLYDGEGGWLDYQLISIEEVTLHEVKNDAPNKCLTEKLTKQQHMISLFKEKEESTNKIIKYQSSMIDNYKRCIEDYEKLIGKYEAEYGELE